MNQRRNQEKLQNNLRLIKQSIRIKTYGMQLKQQLRGKFKALNAYTEKDLKSITFYLKQKKQQTKPKASRKQKQKILEQELMKQRIEKQYLRDQ